VEAISEPPFSVSFLFKDPSSSFCAFSDSPRAGTYQKLEGRRNRERASVICKIIYWPTIHVIEVPEKEIEQKK